MKLLGMRRSISIEPEFFIEADRVHNQRVSLPVTDGMSVIARFEIRRMRTSIHKNGSETMRPADVHDEHALQIRHVYKLDAIGCEKLPRSARRLATRVWLKSVAPILVHFPRPRLERNFTKLGLHTGESVRHSRVVGFDRQLIANTQTIARK